MKSDRKIEPDELLRVIDNIEKQEEENKKELRMEQIEKQLSHLMDLLLQHTADTGAHKR